MNDLGHRMSETTPERPGLAWCAQAAGVFGATCASIGMLFLLALTGGWATFDGGPVGQAAASDLQDGQYYQEQWLNPETGRPYSEQVDEISTDYAALAYFEEAFAEDGWEEPLQGAPATQPDRSYDPVAFEESTPALDPQKPLPFEIGPLPVHPKA